jgi:malonyl-CoA/methylmalonyl-CoA synthetase
MTNEVMMMAVQGEKELELGALKEWCQDRMSGYKVPRKLLALAQMPRNAMGKVNKKDLVKSIITTTATA